MNITDNTLCVVDISRYRIYNFAETYDEARRINDKAIESMLDDIQTWENNCKQYPDTPMFENYLKQAKAKQYEIMTYAEFTERERNHLLGGELKEVTAERFEEMLNVLPPLKWCTIDGIEMFCISEMYTGTYTYQYAHDKSNDKYYSKMVDILDKFTWINELLKLA